jgi:uncharacterized membrane protein
VDYVIAVKRISAVLSVFFGVRLIFEEKEIKERVLGAVIMVLGVFIIIF